MDTKSIIETLGSLGIEEKPATLYATLLGKNRLGIAELARMSGIKRATCYEHLDILLKNDFVVRVPIGKRMFFAASHPKKVLDSYKKKTHDFESKLEQLAEIHENATQKPKVTFYEGKRELERIYEDLFQSMGDTYSIFPPDAFLESFSEEEYTTFDATNSAHAIRAKDLFVASKNTKRLRELRKKTGYENKLDKVLPDWFSTNVDVLIFSNSVALISLRDLSAIVIENKDIAELFKNMHHFMWKSL